MRQGWSSSPERISRGKIGKTGAPDTIRTCDLCLRRATLYPAELRVRWGSFSRLAGPRQRGQGREAEIGTLSDRFAVGTAKSHNARALCRGRSHCPRHRTGCRGWTDRSSTVSWGNGSENFALFRSLSAEQRAKTLEAMVRRDLVRGRNAGGAGRSLGFAVHGAAWRAGRAQGRRFPAVRRTARRRTDRRDRLLRQRAAHRQCRRDPRYQRAGADARGLSGPCAGQPPRSPRRCSRRWRCASRSGPSTADRPPLRRRPAPWR